MRKALLVFTAFCIGTVGAGCNSKSANQPSKKGTPEPHVAPGYSLKLKSKCDPNAGDDCIGLYGFTVFSDGHYQVGPGPAPENTVRTGTLTTEELAAFNKSAGGLLPTPQLGTENRMTIPPSEDIEPLLSEDTITFSQDNGAESVLLTAAGTAEGSELRYNLGSADDAKALHDAIRKLAQAHYELPFPDDCKDKFVPALQKLFTSVQSCSTDADCILVDSSFDPIERGSGRQLILDDCSLTRGIPAANASSVKTEKARLDQATSDAYNSCGQRMYREDCTVTPILENGSPAACKQGVCQLSQSAFF